MSSTADDCEAREFGEFNEFLHQYVSDGNISEQRTCMTRGNSDTYPVTNQEMRAEILSIIWNHLNVKRCPQDFQLILLRLIIEEIERDTINIETCDITVGNTGYHKDESLFDLMKLQKFALNNLEKLITRFSDNAEATNLRHLFKESKQCIDRNTKYRFSTKAPMHLVASAKNKPRKMEDRSCCWPVFSEVFQIKPSHSQYGFYGVFDGHGGSLAAAYAAAQLPQLCAQHLQQTHADNTATNTSLTAQQHMEALRRAFIQTDKQFAKKQISSGTTAVCALHRRYVTHGCESITNNAQQLYVAWVGDSKAMLVSGFQCRQLVRPHKPDYEDERKRIEANGSGSVMFVQGQWRVNGILNLSRSIGDFSVNSVIAEPDVVCVDLKESDDFLILGSDGLWDYVSEEDIATAIYDDLAKKDTNIADLPKLLVNLAKQGDSQDNITVIIILLRDIAKIKNNLMNRKGHND